MAPKELIVVGGPNGAGKSTFVAGFLADRPMPYLCADLIANEFPHLDVLAQQVAAGREFLRRAEQQLASTQDFIVETTMSGRTLRNYLKRARAVGFSITIVFVYLDSADHCVIRVQQRVRRGGHNVPRDDTDDDSPEAVLISGILIVKLPINGKYFIILWRVTSRSHLVSRTKSRFPTKNCSASFFRLPRAKAMASTSIPLETYEKFQQFLRIANRAAREAQEENRRLGIPNTYSINGILYYELPNGELSREDPYQDPSSITSPVTYAPENQ